MDKRIIGFAVLAVLIGAAVIFAEAMLVGVLATMTGSTTPHDITFTELEWRGLWHSLIFTWGLPSALGALIVASFKPRRWRLYSICTILPGVGLFLLRAMSAAQSGIPPHYDVISSVANWALIPMFLALYYALIRRHGAQV